MTPDEISQTFPSKQTAPAVETPNVPTSQPMPPVEQPAVISETPPPSKPKKKLLLIIGIVVLLLVLASAGIFAFTKMQKPKIGRIDDGVLTPPPAPAKEVVEDNMSDWKTYESSQYGFSFKYPSNLDLKDEGNLFIGLGKQESDKFFSYISIYPFDLPGARLSAEEYRNFNFAVEESEVSVGGITSIRKIVRVTPQVPEPQARNTSYLNEVTVPMPSGHTTEIFIYDENYVQVLDQILSTFEFTDSEDSNTFTSKKIKNTIFPTISITHPSEWERYVEQDSYLFLKITKGEYTISMSQDGWGNNECLFEEDLSDINYTELEIGPTLNFRRYEADFRSGNKKTINFCQFDSATKEYIKPGNIVSIQYLVPENYEESKLMEMDEIVKTLQVHE